MNINIFNLSPIFDNGELAEEREATICRNPECKCLFAWDGEFCSPDCEEDFERNKKFEADLHYSDDFDEEQNF